MIVAVVEFAYLQYCTVLVTYCYLRYNYIAIVTVSIFRSYYDTFFVVATKNTTHLRSANLTRWRCYDYETRGYGVA